MTLSFKMTTADYLQGFKIKTKKCKLSKKSISVAIALVAVMLDVSLFSLKQSYYGVVMLVGMLLAGVLTIIGHNKQRVMMFEASPILTGEHTVIADDSALKILNSFEMMSVPWKDLYYAKLTKDLLIILPTYRKGVIVINRDTYKGEELDSLIALISTKAKLEGVKDEKHI